MPTKQKQKISKEPQQKCKSRQKLYCICFMLPIVISIITLLVVTNEISDTSEENEVNSETVSFNDDDQSDRPDKKRLSRSLLRRDSPNDYGYLNVYIRESCYQDRQYAYKKVRFPYARYDRHRFRFSKSWMSVSRWMTVYVDRFTRQTFAYAPEGVFIIPPLINFYEEAFSVAELLVSGHATLRSNGAAMSPYFDITQYIQNGGDFDESMPRFNSRACSFVVGVHSNYRSYFKSKCENEYNDGNDDDYLLAHEESQNEKYDFYDKPRLRPRYSKPSPSHTVLLRNLPIHPSKRNPRDTNQQETDPVDTNPSDATTKDTNPPNTDQLDTNPSDVIPPDTNPVDTNPPDTYSPEANLPDANSPDTSPANTNPLDTNLPDANPSNTIPLNTYVIDTDLSEIYSHATNAPDINSPDTNSLDANPLDPNQPDTNPPDANLADTNLLDTNPLVTNTLHANTPYTNQIDTYPSDGYLPDTNPLETNVLDTNPSDINSPDTNLQDMNPPDTNPSNENPPGTSSPIIHPPNPDTVQTPCDCSVLQGSSILSSYNVMTLGNLSSTADIQGKTIICGSIILDNALVFRGQLPSYFSTNEYVLEIKDGPAGTGGLIQINKGSVAVQCDQSSVSYNGDIQYTVNGRIIGVQDYNNGARLIEDCDLVNRCNNLETSMKTLSSGLVSLEQLPENTINKPTDDNNKLLFKVISTDCNKIAVFNESFQNMIDIPDPTTIHVETDISHSDLFVIINLSGTDIIWPSNIHLDGNWFNEVGKSRTIWNFYEATTITLYSNIMGFILAPYATVNLHANIQGSFAINNLIADAQVHLPNPELPACIQEIPSH